MISKMQCLMELQSTVAKWAIFNMHEDDHGTVVRQIAMQRDDWNAMGSPEKLTVTIEPGDLLNTDENAPHAIVAVEAVKSDGPAMPGIGGKKVRD